MRTVESPTEKRPRDHRDPRRTGGRHQAAAQGRHRPGRGRRAVCRPAVRARRAPGARHERRPRPASGRHGRDRARRGRRADRRREAEDVRRPQGRRRRVPRAGWGKRRRGEAVCREPSHHPGGEFSTGVVRSADTSREIAILQGFCRNRQQALIAALSFSRPLRPGDLVATMPPVRRRHDCFNGEPSACLVKHPAMIATSAAKVFAPCPVRPPAPRSVLSPPAGSSSLRGSPGS